MKEITINVKLKVRDDLDEQDILDHTSAVICQGMHGGGIVEFVDAELAETPISIDYHKGQANKIFRINLLDIIDAYINIFDDLIDDNKKDKEPMAICSLKGSISGLIALKEALIKHDIFDMIPAMTLDKLRGENLVQEMRLDKAVKLLSEAYDAVFADSHFRLSGEIAEFLNDQATDKLNATPGNAGLRTGMES